MIVIPMAGASSRFFNAGYTKPKYMLEAKGITLFEHSVLSFSKYFDSELFVFVVKDIYETVQFVTEKVSELGISNFEIVVLLDNTRGQAESVALGIKGLKNYSWTEIINDSLLVFNIDTFRPGYSFPSDYSEYDGYLEVFIGEGNNWSYVRPNENNTKLVSLTTEKNPVSNLCSTGLYYFRRCASFFDAYNDYISRDVNAWEKNELYVAPLYNHLISEGMSITYEIIKKNEVIFCGTPEEYEQFC